MLDSRRRRGTCEAEGPALTCAIVLEVWRQKKTCAVVLLRREPMARVSSQERGGRRLLPHQALRLTDALSGAQAAEAGHLEKARERILRPLHSLIDTRVTDPSTPPLHDLGTRRDPRRTQGGCPPRSDRASSIFGASEPAGRLRARTAAPLSTAGLTDCARRGRFGTILCVYSCF